MKNEKAIAKSETTVHLKSPAELIVEVVKANPTIGDIKELLAIQKEWDKDQAKKEFVKAMAAFKAEAPIVTKDKVNSQYKSKYTSLSNLINTVNPVLSKHGLSSSWDIEQNGVIKVTCRITHEQGHGETSSVSAPADTSGAKNAIQQIKSTITYLKSVTFESICGLASTDANVDDDGAGAIDHEHIDDKELSELREWLDVKGLKEKELCKVLKVETLETLPKDQFKKAKLMIDGAQKK